VTVGRYVATRVLIARVVNLRLGFTTEAGTLGKGATTWVNTSVSGLTGGASAILAGIRFLALREFAL
jgi:hypothetical protein